LDKHVLYLDTSALGKSAVLFADKHLECAILHPIMSQQPINAPDLEDPPLAREPPVWLQTDNVFLFVPNLIGKLHLLTF